MKTFNYICKIFLLSVLLCGFSSAAVGQVSGNSYDLVEYNSRDILSEISARTTGTGGANVGNGTNRIANAFDGNSSTWWKSTQNGNVYIYFTFTREISIDRIYIQLGGETQERPNHIVFSTSSDGSNWNEYVTVAHNRSEEYFDHAFLSLTTRYLRLTLDPDRNSGETYKLAINEFHFYWSDAKYTNSTIKHKPAKWFDLRDDLGLNPQSLGSFDYETQMFDAEKSMSGNEIQAAHTYIDTIYMHKGESVLLTLPTKSGTGIGGSSSAQTYQRWYSYRTDGTFELEDKNTNNIDGVVDLLTPHGATNVYRFANGYVGRPLGDIAEGMDFYYPRDDQFDAWFPKSSASVDNDWFVVACDVSGYTDFTQDFESAGGEGNYNGGVSENEILSQGAEKFRNGWWEPTISVRVIYYIVGVDNHGSTDSWNKGHNRLISTDYQGGNVDGQYLEEYDITFPAKHLSNYTDELVALSKDARSYAIPNQKDNDVDELNVKIVGNNLRFRTTHTYTPERGDPIIYYTLDQTTTLSGVNRVIKFTKNDSQNNLDPNTTWEVADGTKETILVTKTVNGIIYNIAKYNLTFVANSVPLTQTQVSKLGTTDAEGQDWNYTYRSPEWMEKNLKKLTELTFDYDPTVAGKYGQEEYFPFPLAWDNSSYAFFDGSPWQDFRSSAYYTETVNNVNYTYWYPEFSYYALVNDYVGYGDVKGNSGNEPNDGVGKPDNGYFIYVDASDRPGVLARLPFDEKLCPGSELFVTAWMKSAGQKNNDDAAVLLTVFGVNADGTETPIYRHSSSQIRTTTWLTNSNVPGTGSGTNDWYQLYFSFLNNDEKASEYQSYILQIENNSASTIGGDYYLDDIKVYIAQPSATVTQKEFTCTNERTHMSMELDWDRLMSRVGSENAGSGTEVDGYDAIDFCFIDVTRYNAAYAEAMQGKDESDAAVRAAKKAAIEASVEQIGNAMNDEEGGQVIDEKYMTLYYKTDFDENTAYDPDGKTFMYQNPIPGETGKYAFYCIGSTTDQAGRRLITDFYSTLSPNRPYKMLILIHENGNEPDAEDFAEQLGDACNIETDFYVTSEALLKVNGEVINPSTDFCQGQVFNFSVNMRVPIIGDEDESGEQQGEQQYVIINDGVYFDWFFGTEEEFLAPHDEHEGKSLQSALVTFRAVFPDATDLTEDMINESVEESGQTLTFTQAEYDIIKGYLDADDASEEGGLNNRLVLHRANLDITLLAGGLEMVVQPIQTTLTEEEAKEMNITTDQWARICWSYIPLVLTANDRAPQLHAGFNSVSYPSDDFAPALRIGLDQIQKATNEDNALRVDLRGAELVTESAKYLGTITPNPVQNTDFRHIYLVNTDDPEYIDLFTDPTFTRTSLPVGDITELYAQEYGGESGSDYNDHMNITFDLNSITKVNGKEFTFTPKEGYTYTLAVYFEEKADEGTETINTCYGSFTLPMKVVPKYVMWQGNRNANWNNDANWKRVSSGDLHFASTTGNEANLTDGSNNNTGAFVPMLFTNVVMPENSSARLYMAGYAEGGAVGGDKDGWSGSHNRPVGMGDPTENIQYDLMVYDKEDGVTGVPDGLSTQRYRVNICNDIHFAPGAQILNAEQLIYNKASMDIAVPQDTWTLISSPLKGVVAGDWYANTSGSQANEPYFTGITFDSNKNNRLNPAVFQRSWNAGAMIYESSTANGTAGFDVSEPVWSSVYNDTYVPYQAGEGFSMQIVNASGTDDVVFRLPKDDESYDQHATDATLERTDAGKLLISGLLDRSNPLEYKPNNYGVITKELTTSQDGKYMIVGNPYMAQLDLKEFFAANDNLTVKYWTETENGQGVGGSDSEGNNWLTPDENSVIEPYGAFFVQLKEGETKTTVKFTASMQKLADDGAGDETETTAGLIINAENESGRSGAVLAYGDNAVNGYADSEDVRLMRNLLGNNADELSVYTVAGDVAASINRVKNVQQVPLGVFAAAGDITTLTFTGTGSLLEPSLYDAELDTDTPLTEGYTLTVSGQSHGRYFIRAKGAGLSSGITDVETGGDNGVSVYSVVPRQLTVSSSSPLRSVSVYSVGGALTVREDVADGRCAVTIDNVESGVAVVRVTTVDGTVTKKIGVK